jgi:septum formation protein
MVSCRPFSRQIKNMSHAASRLVLASTSTYRRELLARLQIPFEIAAPDIDESALPGEAPAATAERLAEAKARTIGVRFQNSLIIGSDQVAYNAAGCFGKPGTRDRAAAQLRAMSGGSIVFHTGLCLLNAASGNVQLRGVPVEVGFRKLSEAEIERYLDKEDALNCAGSAKSEGLGISLMRYLHGDDPNALIGLPLIALCDMLRNEGITLP